MSNQYHVFLGLTPPAGFFEQWQNFQRGKARPDLKWSMWYKIHLTLFFWPALSFAELQLLHGQLIPIFEHYHLPESQMKGFHFFLTPEVLYLREVSEDVLEYHNLLEQKLQALPGLPEWEQRRTFTPHWTIARKFHTAKLTEKAEYFHALDKFAYSGRASSVCLFFSKNGMYIPFPFISG